MPRVELIIPGLFNLPTQELDAAGLEAVTPRLHQLLRVARQGVTPAMDFDSQLLQRLGMNQAGLPWAKALDPAVEGAQLLFRAVHLKADINNAIVFPLEQKSEDVDLLINELSEYFKEDCEITSLPDGLYSMRLRHIEAVQGVPHYLTAVGNKVTHYLEQAKSNLDWFKLFNEMQMFLHQHAVNQRRQQNGQLLINSLWCWGGDAYQGERHENLDWFSDDLAVDALGSLVGAKVRKPDTLKASERSADTIVIDQSLLEALKQNPQADLQTLLIGLENNILDPLMSQPSIEIHWQTSAVTSLLYRPSMRWQWWKKAYPLAHWITQADEGSYE